MLVTEINFLMPIGFTEIDHKLSQAILWDWHRIWWTWGNLQDKWFACSSLDIWMAIMVVASYHRYWIIRLHQFCIPVKITCTLNPVPIKLTCSTKPITITGLFVVQACPIRFYTHKTGINNNRVPIQKHPYYLQIYF